MPLYVVCFECNAIIEEPFRFQLFDMERVRFCSAPGRCSMLDERCSHRLALLSEGRMSHLPVDDGNEAVLEYAYCYNKSGVQVKQRVRETCYLYDGGDTAD